MLSRTTRRSKGPRERQEIYDQSFGVHPKGGTVSKPLKVMIIGAGTGGLCLAHGLVANGIAVEVFERDDSPADRQPGYRLSISSTGSAALRSCLPDAHYRKLVAKAADPGSRVTFLDHELNELLRIDLPHADREADDAERPVSRAALRRILLEGVEHIVRFGRKFESFADGPGGTVVARFADGSAADGDLLVGADGASSRVRAQLLPHAKRIDTGITAVAGKIRLNDANRAAIPAPILRGPTPIMGPGGRFLFASAVQYRSRPATVDTAADEREEYVMWGFSARRARFARTDLEDLGAADLKEVVLALMHGWDRALRHLIEAAEPSSVSSFAVKTSVPVAPWPTRNVTLLGDALHNMTPFRGIGANVALRDAAALRRALAAVNAGEKELLPALAAYERDMIDYGFAAVRTSLADMERFHAEGTLSRMMTKAVFRTVNLVPPLRAVFLAGR
jgi:2-polyprenyl-6-methoxyphenol hydroxylase-like FAD-dependent oxidoreductase